MAPETPRLDARTHDDLLREMTARIPRYVPEWTDRSESDPGMALLSLFAWMGETLLWQINRAPERSYGEFLKLLGIAARPARPARAALTFAAAEGARDAVVVPRGTRCEADPPGEDGAVYFETEEELAVLPLVLRAVQSFDGAEYAACGTANDLGTGAWAPFGEPVVDGSALYLGFEGPLRLPRGDLYLTVEAPEAAAPACGAACGGAAGSGAVAGPAWEVWDGKRWAPLSVVRDGTRGLAASGAVHLSGLGDPARSKVGIETAELFWVRARVERPEYAATPRLTRLLLNTVSAVQAVTVRDEVVGSSDGTPEQVFRLQRAPVLAGSLVVEVEEGGGGGGGGGWEFWDATPAPAGSGRG
ncbi:MAG: putative baseplate assembly protein, partial [Planctomycetes bacterium]|nr:putative baseplate assembly protein [Planctomycetota bacterium]